MTNEFEFDVQENEGQLTITHPVFTGSERGKKGAVWNMSAIDSHRFIVELVSENDLEKDGFALCSVDLFKSFLRGLCKRRWSGIVKVELPVGQKRVYFSGGRICFAGSTVMDDRLGEVIYRSGRISLDQMADSATKVSKEVKFGQVLLSESILKNSELWQALQQQVREILRSLFVNEKLYFEIYSGQAPAFTEVVFPGGSHELIDECYAHGCMYRDFVSRLDKNAKVVIINEAGAIKKYALGTFYGDFLQLIRESATVAELVAASKLNPENTYVALMQLINQGVCDMELVADSDSRLMGHIPSALRSQLDAYEIVLLQTQGAFKEAGVAFPEQELRDFAYNLNPEGFTTFFLDSRCRIGRFCFLSVASQCRANPAREHFFKIRIEGLIQFLLQLTTDHLTAPMAKNIRNSYRELSS